MNRCGGSAWAAAFVSGIWMLTCAGAAVPPEQGDVTVGKPVLHRSEIRIRDPFIVPDPETRSYYMFGTTDATCWGDGPGVGFDVYVSQDLEHWKGPKPAFRPPPGFWADRNFWAPEVHRYRGRWYMFASFKAENRRRGTQILVSTRDVQGPYVVHSPRPVTPPDWECLDGTLFVDEAGAPWIVFCHEWVQVHDGEICAQRLSEDLRSARGEPVLLFRGSDAPWAPRPPGKKDFVTDGPFLYRARNGELLMLWSSFGASGYAVGTARSESGRITGPWKQDPDPLFPADGGHAMVFRTFDGRLMLALHQPNRSPHERPQFIPLIEENGRLRCAAGAGD